MANVVVTTVASDVTLGAHTVKVVMNDLATTAGHDIAYFNARAIERVNLTDDQNTVEITMTEGGQPTVWKVTKTGVGASTALPIDSIDGTTPTDNPNLAFLIANLML